MLAHQILEHKGRQVTTVAPDASITAALDAMRSANVGAVVVSADGQAVDGILSERDIVRSLAELGADVLTQTVSALMQTTVHTCTGADHVDQLMGRMTDHRIRHLPVVEDGVLCGIISIGDVVKTRVDELEREQAQLVDYIRTGR